MVAEALPKLDLLLFVARLLLGIVVLGVPGLLVAQELERRRRDDAEGPLLRQVRVALVAVAWGAGVVPTLAFFLHLFGGVRVGLGSIVAVSALHTVGFAWWSRRSGGATWPRLPRLDRATAAVLAAALAVGAFYVLKYDRYFAFNESCLHTTALIATGHGEAGVRLLVENVEDARLGNTGVLAGFVGLFAQPGFRLLYGACGLLLALGGWLLGRLCGGRDVWGWVGLLLLPLNPAVAGIPLVDENLLALSFGLPALVLLMSGRSWIGAGVLFALAVTMRHVLILSLPAVLLLVGSHSDRRSALKGFVGAFVVVTLPENLHHLLAPEIGSLLRFESNPQYPEFPYRFAGFELSWAGMLNWPAHDQIVRTPGYPFPTFVRWPLYVADRLGLLAFAAAAVGAVGSWWRDRRQAAFLLLYCGPVVAALALQEAWDVPNKMGVIVIAFPSFVAWAVHGADLAARHPRRTLPVLAAIIAVGWLGAGAVRDWRPPVDQRYYDVYPGERREYAPRVEDLADQLTGLGLLPDLRSAGWRPAGRMVRELGRELLDPAVEQRRHPWGWPPGEAAPPGVEIVVELDLAQPVHGRTDLLRVVPPGEPGPRPLEIRAGEILLVPQVRVAWDGAPAMLYGTRSHDITSLQLFFADWEMRDHPRRFTDSDSQEQCKLFLLAAGLDGDCDRVRVVPDPGPVLRLRVVEGSFGVSSTINRAAQRVMLWRGVVTSDGARFEPGAELFHN